METTTYHLFEVFHEYCQEIDNKFNKYEVDNKLHMHLIAWK